MTNIATGTTAVQFQYPGQVYLDRPRGKDAHPAYFFAAGHQVLFAMLKSNSGDFVLYRSLDNGTTWSLRTTLTRSNVQEWSSLWCDGPGIHWVYRTNESSQDKIFLRFYDYATETWSSEKFITSASNGGVAGSVYTGLDLIAVNMHWESVTRVGIAIGTNTGGKIGASFISVIGPYPDCSNPTNQKGIFVYTPVSGSGRITPSIDYESAVGTDRVSGTPHAWLSFGRGNLYRVKLPWVGMDWNSGSATDTLGGFSPALDYVSSRWDGERYLICVPWTTTAFAAVLEVNTSNTAITATRLTPSHPTGVVRHATVSYNVVNRDFRVYAIGTSTDVLYYIEYNRGAGTWGSWTQVLATAVLGSGKEYGVRKNNYGNSHYDVYTNHATPAQVHTPHLYDAPPSASTWSWPPTGVAQDVAQPLILDWNFIDPNVGDSQTAYALSRQIGAGSLNYWRASDSTWQTTEQKNTSAVSQISLAASWAAGSDANYSFKVKTWDQADTAGAYSAAVVVIPSVKVDATITSPTEGQVVGANQITPTWTVSEQTLFRIKLTQTVSADINQNPFFETDASNWSAINGATIARSTAQFHQGAASLLTTPNGTTSNPGNVSELLSVSPGGLYQVSCWARGNGFAIRLYVDWYTSSQIYIKSDVIDQNTVSGTWLQYGPTNFEAPGNATYARIGTISLGVISGANPWYTDEIELKNVPVSYDSGWVVDPGTNIRGWAIPTILPDLSAWKVTLQTKNNEGLTSSEIVKNFTVDYIEPSTPTVAPTAMSANGIIRCVISNPTPGGAPATFVNAGTAAFGNNSSVTPGVPAGVQKEDLLVIMASIRNNGTGFVNIPTGWTSLIHLQNMEVIGRYAQLDSLDNPTVTFSNGAANEDTMAQMIAFRGAALSVSASAFSLNASAQNIAYAALTIPLPNQIAMVAAWKQDDWTSVTTVSGMTEIAELISTAGNDAAMVWDYVIQTTAANISSGTITVTGGLAAISVSDTFAINVKPALLYNDLYRRVVGDTSTGLRIASGLPANATYDDFTAVSGVNYEYRVLAVAANGTSQYGAWTQ